MPSALCAMPVPGQRAALFKEARDLSHASMTIFGPGGLCQSRAEADRAPFSAMAR
jgi:hypothetical protein